MYHLDEFKEIHNSENGKLFVKYLYCQTADFSELEHFAKCIDDFKCLHSFDLICYQTSNEFLPQVKILIDKLNRNKNILHARIQLNCKETLEFNQEFAW